MGFGGCVEYLAASGAVSFIVGRVLPKSWFRHDKFPYAIYRFERGGKIYEKLRNADVLVIASPVYFYGISAELKAMIDRLHTPARNKFKIKKLALLLVGAASLPNMFAAIEMQYQLILDFFHLEDIGRIFVQGVKDKGDIQGHPALKQAYILGASM